MICLVNSDNERDSVLLNSFYFGATTTTTMTTTAMTATLKIKTFGLRCDLRSRVRRKNICLKGSGCKFDFGVLSRIPESAAPCSKRFGWKLRILELSPVSQVQQGSSKFVFPHAWPCQRSSHWSGYVVRRLTELLGLITSSLLHDYTAETLWLAEAVFLVL